MPNAAIAPIVLVAGTVVWATLFWMKKRRPVQAWLVHLGLLLLWGVAAMAVLLYMTLDMLGRRDDYGVALMILLFAGLLYIPWFGYAVPKLIRRWRRFKDAARSKQEGK